MKKSMFLLGIAAAALASCTNEEVVEVAQNRVIGFSTFVNNGTRAVSEVTNDNLTSFYVFGDYGSESSWTRVFNNTQVNGGKVGDNSIWTPVLTAYWQPSQSYLFGAYSNGNANTTAAFDAATNALTFSSYDVVSNQKDLIAALGNYTTDTDVSNEDPVNLEFDHMLSQVKFTFTNTDSYEYTMKISNIQIASAITTATGTYNSTGASWNGGTANGTYTFASLDDIADADPTNETDLFVIPQGNENLKVTFTATLWDEAHSEDNPNATGTFQGSLKYTKDKVEGTEDNKWTPGFCYNYTAEINGSMLHPGGDPDEEMYPILFNVDAVEGWEDADKTTMEDGTLTDTTTEP